MGIINKKEINLMEIEPNSVFYSKALQHDLLEFIKGEEPYDCLWCELYSSINCDEVDQVIPEEEADYLRVKYLGIELSNPHFLDE